MNPQFSEQFARYACNGDSIETTAGPIRLVATLYHDDSGDAPDERDEGFWPSLDPEAAGYIGDKSPATLRRQTARAKAILEAWRNDEWWYVGVAVRAYIGETPLTGEYEHALWGVDCNYPDYSWRGKPRNWYPNHYLRDVANDLAGDCYAAAVERLEELADAAEAVRPGRHVPAFCVDGLESADPDAPNAGDGRFPPFRIFHPESQDYMPGTYESRDVAQTVAHWLNGVAK